MGRPLRKIVQRIEVWKLLLACLLLGSVPVPPARGAGENGTTPRTWKEVAELSAAELAQVT